MNEISHSRSERRVAVGIFIHQLTLKLVVPSDLANLLMSDERVLLCEPSLLLLHVVKLAPVLLSVAVLTAESEITLAVEP